MKAGTIVVICFFTCWLILNSCKRELSCENCRQVNKPPIANAGGDTIIVLPIDSVSLNGNASTDPDGKIVSYQWSKISGPSSSDITKPSQSLTKVKSLVKGVYQFKLTVTDDDGLSSSDTVSIRVNDALTVNRPPVANAGPDQTFTLPLNIASLDGSASSDPDNNIVSYSWTKIEGSSAASFANANAVITQAKDLVQGVYLFELKVTDAGGLFSKDTVSITVNALVSTACDNSNRPRVNAQLISLGNLSKPGSLMSVSAAGSKIVFAGRRGDTRVDIYDINTKTWSTAELSVARTLIAIVAAGNKIFFGGGETNDGTFPTKAVDIYDVSTNTWSTSALSTAAHSMAGSNGGKQSVFCRR